MTDAFETLQITNQPGGLLVVEGTSPVPILLSNLDSNNTIYLGDSPAVDPTNPSITAPLPPLSSVIFDPQSPSVYARTLSGQTAQLGILPGGLAFYQFLEIITKILEIAGTNGGMFVYNANKTALESSNCGAPTTDPVLGISCPQGFATYNSFGKIINLLSTNPAFPLGFYQYRDTGAVQGTLVLSVITVNGADPLGTVGFTLPAGLFGYDPAFGDSLQVLGSLIILSAAFFTSNATISVNHNAVGPYLQLLSPQETGTGAGGRFVSQWVGDKNDGTMLAQSRIWRSLNDGNTHACVFGVCGNLTAVISGTAEPGTLETWHAITPLNGWTQATGQQPLFQTKLLADSQGVALQGSLVPGTKTDGTQIGQMPAGYFNTTHRQNITLGMVGSTAAVNNAPWLGIDTTGAITINGVNVAGLTRIVFTGTLYLDA